MNKKYLGKIESITFGFGGYQEVMFGLTINFSFDKCSGISSFIGTWSYKPSKDAQWTVKDQDKIFLATHKKILSLLVEAQCDELNQLVNKPVELTLVGQKLESWRILKEVL